MSSRDIEIAKLLATGGYDLDREIQRKTNDIVKAFPSTDVFLIAIAQSLTWTGHAIDKNEYYVKALDFLRTGSESALFGMKDCFGRYGVESLQSTLFNWRKLCDILELIPTISEAKLEEIIDFHSSSLDKACMARKENKVIGVGAWLFCAPFKILLCLRDELWTNRRIDEIRMPLGFEVVRGVKKMIRKKYSYCDSIYADMLSEEEGDIIEGLGTVEIIQAISKKIAKDANSIVLHINSGFWKLGAGDL